MIVTEQPPSSSQVSSLYTIANSPKCRPSFPLPLLSQPPPPRCPRMLSSFINRRKVKKISLFDAALRRAPSSPSSEIHSDRESPRSRQLPPPPGDQAQAVTALRSSALNRQSSPKVHLDFTPSSSNDWFPQEILVPYDEDGHLPVQPIPQSGTLSAYDDVVVIGSERVSIFLSFPTPRLS